MTDGNAAMPAGSGLRRLLHRARPAPARLMPRYAGGGWLRRHRKLCFALLLLTAVAYGFAFAIFGRVLLLQLATPLAAAAALVIWLLPESGAPPTRALGGFTTAFLIALLCWPDYLALALPGLPWITAIRLFSPFLALSLLVCVSVSPPFRAEMARSLSAAPAIWKMMVVFVAIALASIAFSTDKGNSISKFVVAQMTWTTTFFAACYLFLTPGRTRRLAAMLWGITIFVCLIGVWEARISKLPWAGHIPWFLTIEDESVQRSITGTTRGGNGLYRVHSKFGSPLGLGEFLGLSTPFILHIMITARRLWLRVAAFATLPLILYVTIHTDSRLALIGFLGALMCYLLAWGVLRWRRDRADLIGPAIVFGYPFFAALCVIAVLSLQRLRVMVLGGGSQQASTDARQVMYETGIPMVLRNPIGHGMGQGAATLGYTNPGGILTIDTYYLAVALEYGVIGFVCYYGMLLAGIWGAGKTLLRVREPELLYLAPLGIALINFFVSKSVFSQQENHPLVFVLLGVIVALMARQRAEGTAQPEKLSK